MKEPNEALAPEAPPGTPEANLSGPAKPEKSPLLREVRSLAVRLAVCRLALPKENPAPIVLAKGQDELAARIVRTAEEHKVAVVENVPLARALYASTDLNQVIPPELYNAVAEVLVYLYRMDQKIP